MGNFVLMGNPDDIFLQHFFTTFTEVLIIKPITYISCQFFEHFHKLYLRQQPSIPICFLQSVAPFSFFYSFQATPCCYVTTQRRLIPDVACVNHYPWYTKAHDRTCGLAPGQALALSDCPHKKNTLKANLV